MLKIVEGKYITIINRCQSLKEAHYLLNDQTSSSFSTITSLIKKLVIAYWTILLEFDIHILSNISAQVRGMFDETNESQ